jgi:uncharacterized protein YcbK (DUF882 family)
MNESMGHVTSRELVGRRQFLALGAAACAGVLLPRAAEAAAGSLAPARLRSLAFFNTHTDERLSVAYARGREYQPAALDKINFILRDFRVNEVKPIDPALLDLLHTLHGDLESDQPIHIISGYRSPKTNAMLRSQGGLDSGVASGSLHMAGKAIDIRMPGVPLATLRDAARALKRGGVGFYPSSNFVHVDTGRVRHW